MMMVPVVHSAEQVRMATVRLVKPVEDTVLDEQVERPKDSCAADAGLCVRQALQQIIGSERALSALNLINDSPAGTGESVACIL
jgi:hypothetical protein